MFLSTTLRATRRWNPPLLAFGATMAVLTGVCLGGVLLDPRTLDGLPIWMKPLKFSISFVLYAVALAWMLSLLSTPRAQRAGARLAAVLVACSSTEMVVIVTQVIRGTHSHFNSTTTLNTILWVVMGATIAVLWVATALVAVILIRERTMPPAMGTAVRLGLVVALAGLALGFLMLIPTSAQLHTIAGGGERILGAHTVGGPDGGPGLPLVGWSTTSGDLRIPHFVGMHALQGLPLLALALSVLAPHVAALRPEVVRRRLVVVAGAAWAGLTAVVTVQALRGQPLLTPDGPTLASLVAVVLGTVLAAVVICRRGGPGTVLADRPHVVAPSARS